MNSEQPSARARICICVDDFGMSEGVNEAVLKLAERERIQATSCMVFGPAWPMGAAALRQLDRQKMDVGLHLDVTQCPSRPYSRQSLKGLILKSALGLLPRAEIRAEIRTQLDAFEQAMGRPPAYVDGHQHVHQLRGIREELVDEIKTRYRTSTPWIRLSRGLPIASSIQLNGWRTTAKSLIITGLGAPALSERLRAAHLQSNHHLLGIYGFSQDKREYDRLLDSWLSLATDSDLLMCHPSMSVDHDEDAIAAARLTEFASLNDDTFEARLAARGIQLMPMSEILRT